MESLKQLELIIFERMYTLQRGRMESEFGFIVSQVANLVFKNAFVLTIFIFPIDSLNDAVKLFFTMTAELNLIITLVLLVFLSSFLFLGMTKIACLQQKSKHLMQSLIPWVDIFSMLILTISIQLLMINIAKNVSLIAFNILSIICISFIHLFYNLFNFSKEPRSSNLFKKRQAKVDCFCNISMFFFCFYLAATYFSQKAFTNEQAIIISLIQLIVSLIKIKQRIFMQFYLSSFSQNVSSLFYFVQLNLGLLVALYYIMSLDLISQNLIFILLLMTSLQYSALNAFIERRNSGMYLSSASDLKSEDQAHLYLDRLCELITKVQLEEDDIILASLKKKHVITCKNIECYCRTSDFQLGFFIKEYVRCELQLMTDMFHNSLSILISILYFKMVIFKYYPEILAKLNYYSAHFNPSLAQRYYKYCLSQHVTEFIRKKNYEIAAVDSEHMFKLEEIRIEIEIIIKGEIEVRNKKWKYLSRGLCRISELEHSCNQSLRNIARLMSIFQENKVKFKKSKEFNLLLLFYFVKVSFINNGKEIRENLKELYFGYKEDELYNLKEFKKFIYHKRSCVIETLIDTKTMGIVTAASRNVEDMFGFPTSKVIGISINNLMPQFMAEEHETIMSDWAKSGTWRTIGKLKEIYCVHKEQYCFSALIYLKIYIKDSSMHFITNIFKLNENDYLVINPNFKIEGLGRKFLKLLGEPAKRMSLELLVEQDNNLLSQQTYVEGKLYRNIFLSLRSLESEVDNYLESINMKFDEGERREINRNFHERLVSICQEKYYVEFSIKRYKMRSIQFLVIGLKEAKKIEKHMTLTQLDRPQPSQQVDNSKDLIDYDVLESEESSFEKEDENDQLIIDHNASSSLTSLSEKENYPIAKTIERFIGYVQQPCEIRDQRLQNFNVLLLVILVSLSVINFISYYCYKEMLLEIEGIFFADGAQSDVMQTTELSYDYIYMLKSQLSNSSKAEFASTLASARLIMNYVYSLREADFSSLITNVTELTKERLYTYLEKPAIWMFNNRPTEVLTHQFLENMYYLSERVMSELERLRESNSTSVNYTFFQELFNNFPEMESLNEFYLDDYQRISNGQHLMLNYFTICSMLIYFILSLVLSVTLNNYFKFRFTQLYQSFNFFSYIPNQFLERMKEYYSLLLSTVVEPEKLKAIDVHEDEIFQIDTYELFHKNDSNKSSLTSKIKFLNYENYYKWMLILLLFCLFNTINYLATAQIRNFFSSSQTVITEISQLMRSENKIFENYFDLRAAYSLDPDRYLNDTLYRKLIATLNETDTNFNSVANKLTVIFSQYDPNYEANFVNVLVGNICRLSAPFLTPFENAKCLNELRLNILDGGILISMNYFQRNVRTALEDLRLQYIVRNASVSGGDYFRQLDFVELDKMLIYMFKVYQQTQAVSYNSYICTIGTITTTYLQLTVFMTVFFLAVLLVWLRSIGAQKEGLSYLYGHLLLIPFMILKSNTRIASSLKEAIEYSDS